jgi:hypothetical protein
MRKKTGPGLVATTIMIMATGVACGGGGSGTVDSGGGSGSTLPNCTSSGKNAFETYGSAGLSKVVANTALNVEADLQGSNAAMLGSSFMMLGSAANGSDYADDQTTFLNKLTAFMIFAYGGPSTTVIGGTTFNGDIDMVAAHTGMHITQDQFNYFLMSDVIPAVTASGVGSADLSSCIAPVVTSTTFEASIIGH